MQQSSMAGNHMHLPVMYTMRPVSKEEQGGRNTPVRQPGIENLYMNTCLGSFLVRESYICVHVSPIYSLHILCKPVYLARGMRLQREKPVTLDCCWMVQNIHRIHRFRWTADRTRFG